MTHNLAKGLVAVDDGGFTSCVVTKDVQEKFYSVKGLYGKRNLVSTSGRHDFVVEYKGEKYVAGSLAKFDCTMPLQMHTESKQNLFYDLSVLIAIHQYGYMSNYLVVSVPIEMHTEEEKRGRIERLIGSHKITVNGVTKTFSIADVKVAPETASAYWIEEPIGMTRYLDLGSRTIGYATTLNENGENRFIDTQSGTLFGKGLEALAEQYNAMGLADYICGRLLKIWNRNDNVRLLGGGALDNALVNCIKQYFPNTEVMSNPQMSTVNGMYNLGRLNYDMD